MNSKNKAISTNIWV